MLTTLRAGRMALCCVAALLAADVGCFAQGPTDNPYRPVKGLADGGGPSTPGGEWARLPDGREMGPPASLAVDADGESIWAFIRCDETSPLPVAKGGRFGLDCMLPDGKLKPHDTIYKFDAKGQRRQKFWRGNVHLAAWIACGSRRQCMGDRCGWRRAPSQQQPRRGSKPGTSSASSARMVRC